MMTCLTYQESTLCKKKKKKEKEKNPLKYVGKVPTYTRIYAIMTVSFNFVFSINFWGRGEEKILKSTTEKLFNI